MFRRKLFANHAISRYEMRFWNPTFVKVRGTCIYFIFMLGTEWGNSAFKGNSLNWRWEDALQCYVRIITFQSNATRKCMQINKITHKPAEPLMVRTVSRRPVTTSAHVGFVVETSETDISQGTLVLPFQYHSITAPYSFILLSLMLCHHSKLECR